MPKILQWRDDYHVKVYIDTYRKPSDCVEQKEHERMVNDLKWMADEIRRHVDDVAHVQPDWESGYVCEYCGYPWGEESTLYNGGCCDEDEKHSPEKKDND